MVAVIADSGGALEVDFVAGFQVAEGGQAQGFLHGVEVQPLAFLAGNRQAGAVDGNRGTDGYALNPIFREIDQKGTQARRRDHVFDPCNALSSCALRSVIS